MGENNIYLHGLPYALAPEEQKRCRWYYGCRRRRFSL
ncbi:MAG: hypothetical protein ACLU99_09665 [Alphaproteobacteria bacterium]